MPQKNRRKPPFWRCCNPHPQHDIAKLLPPKLPLGKRFETLTDALRYNEQSAQRMKSLPVDKRILIERLNGCSHEHRCDQTYCHRCARLFRRWFIGQLLQAVEGRQQQVQILTVLLEEADRDDIERLDQKRHDATMRKRLIRSGLADAIVVGGYEMVYRAQTKSYILHVNLVIIGGDAEGIEQFTLTFQNNGLYRPVLQVQLEDPAEQLSYILKFTTYHRPHAQWAAKKGNAVPLNPREHCALVCWMAQRTFKDHLFLFNARRRRSTIEC
jgi:hypothetical protein